MAVSQRRNPNQGLFNGYWLTPDLQKTKHRVSRAELGECYRLWHKHRDIRLDIFPIGIKSGLHR